MRQKKATLIGLIAVVMFSTLVGLIKSVSEGLGAVGGAAMIYTLASVLLMCTVGIPNLRNFPRPYLLFGSILFVAYELCLSLSLGFSHTAHQAIEVGMVNYLWPSLTIVFTVIATRTKTKIFIVPGMMLSIAGIATVLGGEQGLAVNDIVSNLYSNPLSYGLAFIGAIIWSVYCVMTKMIARGSNGITLFFSLTALTLWIKYFIGDNQAWHWDFSVIASLVLAACAMGFGYASWNYGVLYGNVTVMATASYFVPVFSSVLAAVILQTPLTLSFWQGSAMVSIGSLICWWSTRTQSRVRVSG